MMIKFEHTETAGWVPAFRGMRNPLNSWHKADSCFTTVNGCDEFIIGPNDADLASRLLHSGSDHSKFMRQIVVWVDITAPFYLYKELDTYRMGIEKNSCSTMHTIHRRDLTESDFSTENIVPECRSVVTMVINMLNKLRRKYVEVKDKSFWYSLIHLLPDSFNQRRTYMFSYAALRNIYHARKNHKLNEWREFCRWVESLPNSWLITDV